MWPVGCSRGGPMGYSGRQYEPPKTFFVSSPPTQSLFLMAPSAKTTELIGGTLARSVRQSGVELFAYVFTSNHFHALVRAPTAIAMSTFMQQLKSDIARKVGELVE